MRSLTTFLTAVLIAAPTLAVAAGSEAADAAQRKDVPALRTLVTKRANVNAPQADGTTALHWAVHYNDAEMAKLLLKAGASPSATNRFDASPLSEAALSGNAELLKLLLDAGADAKALATLDGETVLMSAARSGNVESVRMLLDRGADVNAREKYRGQTALMWAAAERHAPVVKLLLERGADWKIRSFDRETRPPRLSAASSISPIPRGGFTALMFAAGVGYRDKNTRGTEAEALEALKVLVEAGLDLRLTNTRGETALHGAASRGADTIVQYLVDHGAELNRKTKQGFTPLDIAMGKAVVIQLPVPQESTVALLKRLGGKEGPGPRGAKPPAAQ